MTDFMEFILKYFPLNKFDGKLNDLVKGKFMFC